MKNRSLLFIVPILLILALLLGRVYFSNRLEPASSPVISETEEEETSFEAGIAQIDKFGNVTLTISPDSMKELGYEPGDVASVKVADYEADMPLGTAFSDVDSFSPVCLFINDHDNGLVVKLAINSGSMAETAGIATRYEIDEDPGYAWNFNDESIFQEGVDLNSCAESFLLEAGMSEEEINTLKENLAQDYGGLS